MNNNASKPFDAVKMMREIREKISAETQNMNYEQLKRYIEKKRKEYALHLEKQK